MLISGGFLSELLYVGAIVRLTIIRKSFGKNNTCPNFPCVMAFPSFPSFSEVFFFLVASFNFI